MNLEQRISNLERNAPAPVPGNGTLGRIELVNTTSTQSIANGSLTTVGNGTGSTSWTVSENIGGIFTHSLGRVTCGAAGRYAVWGSVRWDSNASQRRQITIRKNAGGSGFDLASLLLVATSNIRIAISAPSIRLDANDTLDLTAYQDSGSARTLAAITDSPLYFIVEYLGA